jgi:hypothetical protein
MRSIDRLTMVEPTATDMLKLSSSLTDTRMAVTHSARRPRVNLSLNVRKDERQLTRNAADGWEQDKSNPILVDLA